MPVGALNEGIQKLARDSVDALVPLIMQRVYADDAWLPTLATAGGSVTHVTRRGTFTRVGGQVWFHAQIALSAVSSPTGDVTITGLPLVSAQRGGAWLVNMAGVTLSAGYSMLSGEIAAGTSTIKLRQQGSAVAALTLLGTALSATTTIEIAGMYYASDIVTLSLEDAILARSPIQYLKLDETSGATFADRSGNGRTGTASGGVTPGFIMGAYTAARLDGIDGRINLYSASLAGAFTPNVGSITVLVTLDSDLTGSFLFNLGGSASRSINSRAFTDQPGSFQPTVQWQVVTDLVLIFGTDLIPFGASPFMMGVSWDTSDTIRLYINGALVAVGTSIVPWGAFALAATRAVIGAQTTTTGVLWTGAIAHWAIFGSALSAADFAAIYAASGL